MDDPVERPLERAAEKAVEEGVKAARDFLATIGGPAATEFGGALGDWVKYWRFKNMVKITLKTKEFLERQGIEARKVLPATMVPLLEAASLTEDDMLQEKWAALLASAANPAVSEVSPAYVAILRDLSPVEVLVLDRGFERASRRKTVAGDKAIEYGVLENEIVHWYGLGREDISIMATNLARLGLWEKGHVRILAKDDPLASEDELRHDETIEEWDGYEKTAGVQRRVYRLTPLAADLIRRCKPPSER